jgi:hypothetical protein
MSLFVVQLCVFSSHSFKSSQKRPNLSKAKPGGHEHLYEPGVFVHIPAQMDCCKEHSSISFN